MQDQSPLSEQSTNSPKLSPRLSVSVVAALSTAVLLTGGVAAWLTLQPLSSQNTAPTASSISPAQPQTTQSQVPVEQTVQVYWLKDTGTKLELVPTAVDVPASNQPAAVLKGAFEELLKAPSDQAIASTIPPGTKLRNLDIRADGIHVDLSQDFVGGGGSASMSGRLAQVIYTATTLAPNAKVWISVDGKPLETLGGEGLVVDQPMTRAAFDQNFQL